MFNWIKRRKKEETTAQDKRDAMKKKSDASDALIRSVTGDRRIGFERRREVIEVDWERRHA